MAAGSVASPGVGGGGDGVSLPASISSGLDAAFSDDSTSAGSSGDQGDDDHSGSDETAGLDAFGAEIAEELSAPAEGDEQLQSDDNDAEPVPGTTTDPALEAPGGGTIRKRANGKEEYVYSKERGEKIYGGYSAAKEAEGILGVPLTKDAVTALHNSSSAYELMHSHFESGDPELQAGIIDHLLLRGDRAMEQGEAQTHPMVALAQTLPTHLLSSENPAAAAAFHGLRNSVMESFLPALIEIAQDPNLVKSAQHIQQYLFNKYDKPKPAGGAPDPNVTRISDLERREQTLSARETENATKDWNDWSTETKANNEEGIDNAVEESVKSVAKHYEALPGKLDELKKTLKERVLAKMKDSKEFNSRVRNLTEQARIARSAAKRLSIKDQLATTYKQRAAITLETILPEVNNEFAKSLKTNADVNNGRRQLAQENRVPGASGGTPARSIVPPRPQGGQGQSFDQKWKSDIEAALA